MNWFFIPETGDLLRRYGATFRHAWKCRSENEANAYLSYEAQFLPSALALQETPVSPAPRVAMWLMITFTGLALLWSMLADIDVVASAHGKIVSDARIQVIQSMETATIKAIHVMDGQFVKAGDVLIELDSTVAKADKDVILGDLAASRLLIARSEAMLMCLSSGNPPKLHKAANANDEMLHGAERLLMTEYEEYIAKLNRIEAEIVEKEAEIRATQELVHGLEQLLPITEKQAQDFKSLVARNFVSKHQYLESEQARIELISDLASHRMRVKQSQAALQEAHGRKKELVAETRRINMDRIIDGEHKAVTLEHELIKASSRNSLLQIKSPIDGVVQQLAVHTQGGVVTPAQQLMSIATLDAPKEIEAFIENKDIGFVKPDQDAEVKIETFPYTKFGTLAAKVVSVSQDAINDDKRGLVYSVRVELQADKRSLGDIHLSQGMAASVEIKTGKRRVMDYFISPLKQYAHESFRER